MLTRRNFPDQSIETRNSTEYYYGCLRGYRHAIDSLTLYCAFNFNESLAYFNRPPAHPP